MAAGWAVGAGAFASLRPLRQELLRELRRRGGEHSGSAGALTGSGCACGGGQGASLSSRLPDSWVPAGHAVEGEATGGGGAGPFTAVGRPAL